MITAESVFPECEEILGICDEKLIFQKITRALEVLSSKPCQNSVTFDPLLVYVDLPVTDDYFVVLPLQVLKPLKVNINKHPALSRLELYEFALNGPGTTDEEAGFQWQDRLTTAIQRNLAPKPGQFYLWANNADDEGVTVEFLVEDTKGNEKWISLITQPNGSAWTQPVVSESVREIRALRKPVTKDKIYPVQAVNATTFTILAEYGALQQTAEFNVIKLSKKAVEVRMLARRRTFAITKMDDIIPLNSGTAVVMMVKALKLYFDDHYQEGSSAETIAVGYLNEEQQARNIYFPLAQVSESPIAWNLNINARDSLVVADVIDQASDVFGNIGQEKLFDYMTATLEVLQNLGQWDGLIGYVDLRVDVSQQDVYYVTLPRCVDQVLAINMGGMPTRFRSKWYEFHLDGWGSRDRSAPAGGSIFGQGSIWTGAASGWGCSGCGGGWEEVGEVVTVFEPKHRPFQLVAIPELQSDADCVLRVEGFDQDQVPIYDTSDPNYKSNPGFVVPCIWNAPLVPNLNVPPLYRFERVTKSVTKGFINLWTVVNGALDELVAVYYPDDTIPLYRRIKVSTAQTVVRMRYRKRWLKIQSMTDPLHIKSRAAFVSGMFGYRSQIPSGPGGAADPGAAIAHYQLATKLLDDEWSVSNPNQAYQVQFDRATFGGNFPVMM